MRKILFVLESLDYSGAAKQVSLAVAGLPRDQLALWVCTLGKEGPAGEKLRDAGVQVEVLGGGRLVNLAAFWRLRQLLRTIQPDVIHTWGRPSLRMVALAARGIPCRLLASAPFSFRNTQPTLGRWDRWLIRRVDRIVVSSPADGEHCRLLGLPSDRICVVPPGVEMPGAGWGTNSQSVPQPAAGSQRWVVCAGPLEPHKGYRDAIWAFDILQFLYEDVRLVVVGEGTYRQRLQQFAQATGAGRRVHFTGLVPDLAGVLAKSEVVWVPSLAEGGLNVALEAMALGRAVVASRLPGLADIIRDGETGILVTPGRKVELARQTRLLLDRPERRRQLGEAGRRWVSAHFSNADLVRRLADLYSLQWAA
jgi:glycosyltransferase involved in cell wall biosynthesis